MTDQKIPEEVPVKKKKNSYKELHEKSLRQLAEEEQHTTVSEEKAEKPVGETSAEEEPEHPSEEKNPPVVEEKHEDPKIDPQKVAEEAATKAAQETAKSFKEELDRIHQSEQSELEKKKAEDELVSVWEKEQRLPTDYKEIFNESRRISRIEAQREYQQLMAERDRKDQETKLEEERRLLEAQRNTQQRLEEKGRQVQQEVEELYAKNILKRPVNITDPDDEGVKQTNDFLQFGIKLNQDRVSRGLDPVDSVTKLYFLHYKLAHPDTPVKKDTAGADAPISGARTTPQREVPEGSYVYSRDHKKTFRQLLADMTHRGTQS